MVLTIPDDLEKKIGKIENHPQYPDILLRILKKIVPHKDIYGTLDEVDFTKWIEGVVKLQSDVVPQEIDQSQIKPGTSFI